MSDVKGVEDASRRWGIGCADSLPLTSLHRFFGWSLNARDSRGSFGRWTFFERKCEVPKPNHVVFSRTDSELESGQAAFWTMELTRDLSFARQSFADVLSLEIGLHRIPDCDLVVVASAHECIAIGISDPGAGIARTARWRPGSVLVLHRRRAPEVESIELVSDTLRTLAWSRDRPSWPLDIPESRALELVRADSGVEQALIDVDGETCTFDLGAGRFLDVRRGTQWHVVFDRSSAHFLEDGNLLRLQGLTLIAVDDTLTGVSDDVAGTLRVYERGR